LRAIDAMTAIHGAVEAKRGAHIPDWAYRDVLFMLIDYSIRSFEVLERALNRNEKQEIFEVFTGVGIRMGLTGLPGNFEEWEQMRQEHLLKNMQHSTYTTDLFRQYRKHLGSMRYRILLEVQTLVVPQHVCVLLGRRRVSFLRPLIALYKLSRIIKADGLLKALILPPLYKNQIRALDIAPV